MKSEYAPAPYRVDAETPNHGPIITDNDGKGRDLAEIRGETKAERAATATLMAAAPDLIEALRALADVAPSTLTSDRARFAKAMASAELAIAKAEGRS